jgi:cell division protein FtsB
MVTDVSIPDLGLRYIILHSDFIMISKLKDYQKAIANQISRFGDIRFTGQLIFVVIILLISWSGVRAIQTNYGLQQQAADVQQQNQLSELENNNISLQNQYYNSNQYLELSARQNFGLAFPGEQELIVPSNVALDYTVNLPSSQSSAKPSSKQPQYQQNFENWVDFFLHRNDFVSNK